jgi:hypothetical protein
LRGETIFFERTAGLEWPAAFEIRSVREALERRIAPQRRRGFGHVFDRAFLERREGSGRDSSGAAFA